MKRPITRRLALQAGIAAAIAARLGSVAGPAGARAQSLTPRAALDRLFSATTVDPDWIAQSLLQLVPISSIQAETVGLHGLFGAYASVQVAGDGTFAAAFDGGTVLGTVALDDAGRIATLRITGLSYALAPDEQEISFSSGSLTVYGTLLLPAGTTSPPAALLIAGSGPTDRNGNSPLLAAQVNTLAGIARALANAGVASLRYDKLGSGKTGTGGLRGQPDFQPFIDEALAGYRTLTSRPEVDATRVTLSGHSEGGLLALIAAQQLQGGQPPAALLLAAPLSEPVLNTSRRQVVAQLDAALAAGGLSQTDHDTSVSDLDRTITAIRAGGTVPADAFSAAPGLRAAFPAGIEPFLREEDSYDPAVVAQGLPPSLPVLIVHGDQDQNVTDGEIEHLLGGFTAAGNTGVQWDEFVGVNHELLVVPAGASPAPAASPPFSPDVAAAISAFAGAL